MAMFLFLSLIGSAGAPVNLELPNDALPGRITDLIMGTPAGAWCFLPGMIEGQEVRVYVRPDSFRMFFIHETP